MYAVLRSGGHQHRVTVGDTFVVERLPGDVGDTVELSEILLITGEDSVNVGQPTLDGAKVLAKVVGQVKGPKVRIFKYHPRKRYRRRAGHRQHYTRLRVEQIVVQ